MGEGRVEKSAENQFFSAKYRFWWSKQFKFLVLIYFPKFLGSLCCGLTLRLHRDPQWLLLLGASNITTLEPFQNPRHFLGCACVLSCFSRVWLYATLWAVTCQAPLSMDYSRQEYWGGLPISFFLCELGCSSIVQILPLIVSFMYTWLGRERTTWSFYFYINWLE